MGLFDKNVKRKGKGLFSAENPYDTESVNRQIANADQRIQDAGYEKADADKRNWFEKATNLPQKQNWFFDTLELLGRPGNAVKNVIDKNIMDKTENLGEAAWKGFSGQEKVTGADLAEDFGVNNKVGKFALGLGLDIATDPLTYIPGGVLARGVKSSAGMVAKPIKAGYNLLEKTAPVLKNIRENRIQPAFESGKDALGYMFKKGYRDTDTLSGGTSTAMRDLAQQTDNSLAYMNDENMLKVGKIARDAGGLEKGDEVGRIVEAPLRQYEDVKGYEFPGGSRRTTDKKELFSEMDNHRKEVESLGKEVNQTRRSYETAISQSAQELDKIDRQLARLYFREENKNLRQMNAKKVVPPNAEQLAKDKAFADLSPSPAFNYLTQRRDELKTQLDKLRTESQTVNTTKIDRIQKLVSDIEELKQSAKNPVMIQQEIKRPVRELSSDPKIQQAAKSIMESNDDIRDFAYQNDIPISEMEGYMTHVWSQEERAFRDKITRVDQGSYNTGNPKKAILNQRTLTGSAEDISERMVESGARPAGHNHTEPNAFFASAIGQKRLIDYIHAVSFRRKVLSDTNFAIPYEKGMSVPKNAEIIDSNNYKFLKETGDPLDGVVQADNIGGQYIVTKAAKQLLDRYQAVNTDEGTKAFLKAYDKIQSFWKRGALFSLGYHVRNQAGAMFNNYVGGMSPGAIAKYTKQGFEEVAKALGGKESALFTEYRKQGLSASALSQVEFAKFGEEPEKAIEQTIKNLSKSPKEKVTQRLNPLNAFQTSQEVGNFFDQANRFALFKWAVEKKGMSYEEAAKKVREVQFDYSKTTPFESRTVARVLPFYRWMKNNIPFQIKQFVNDPRKYEYVNKARLNAQDVVGLDDENIPDYMKENFSIPLFGEEGKGKMLGLNLPIGDLTKLSRPGKTIVDAISPLLKTPIELSTNYNMFRGKKIENFEGQDKQYDLFGNEVGIPIKTAYALEQATGQIGRGLSGLLQKPEDADQDSKVRLPSLGINSLTKDFDAEQYAYYEKLNELRQMQDLILFIEQQTGEKPRTINEIKKDAK